MNTPSDEHPYRDSPTASRGPDVVFDRIPITLWYPKRELTFSRTMAGGRCHALIGNDDTSGSVIYLAGDSRLLKAGSVTVGGSPATPALASFYQRERPKKPSLWRRLFPVPPIPEIDRLEKAMGDKSLCLADGPFQDIAPADRDRVIRAVRAAVTRGATVIVRCKDWSDALCLGDVFHPFQSDGGSDHFGDLEPVFRPGVRDPRAPDAAVNPIYSSDFVADFDGVRVALNPKGSSMSVSAAGGGGFIAWQWKASFHVPARHVIVNPPFAHGTPSGSPPLPPRSTPPMPNRQYVQTPLVDPGPIDPTARLVVDEGEIVSRYRVGAWLRLVLQTRRNHQFQADVSPEDFPPDQGKADPRTRVQFGFDSAHVMSV